MDWRRGFSSKYYVSILDRDTWRDLRQIEITGGTIKKEDSDLRESADVDCVNYEDTSEQIIRVWLDARQNGDSIHTPLFTGIATSPERNIEGHRTTNTLQCYSILKIAQDMLLPRGWYAPVGISGGELIRDLLNVIPIDISISENSPGLKSAIIAEDNENRLSMTDKILNAINWRMKIDGYGNIRVEPHNSEPIATFDSLSNDVIEPSLSIKYDWYGVPNVYRAVLDDSYAVARDDNPNSPLSTVSRGREIWLEDPSVYLQEKETLAEYAERMLKKSQQVGTSISYTRRFNPDVYVSDVVRLGYSAQKISGIYRVTSQSITLGYNAKTSEEVIKIG